MSEQSTIGQELEQITDKNVMAVKGKNYTVSAMPLAYVHEYMAEPAPFFTPTEENKHLAMYNFATIKGKNGEDVDMEKLVRKWVPRLLEYNGRPCTLEMLYEHKWSVDDFDKFLKKALLISG